MTVVVSRTLRTQSPGERFSRLSSAAGARSNGKPNGIAQLLHATPNAYAPLCSGGSICSRAQLRRATLFQFDTMPPEAN